MSALDVTDGPSGVDVPLLQLQLGIKEAGTEGQRAILPCLPHGLRITPQLKKEHHLDQFSRPLAMTSMNGNSIIPQYLCGNNKQQGARACGLAAGPAQKVKLAFKLFNVGMYTVDSLLAQPTQPASACSNSSSPTAGVKGLNTRYQASTIASYWTNAQYKCYWRAINPDTKVAVALGPIAAKKYGTNISLWQSLHGRGDTYKTLLREATTAYLNAFNSLQFPYNAVSVVQRTNNALSGSPRVALLTALKFKRANSGYGKIPCKLTPCK
ncbi:unnamed protein product [Rhodiola kirilowii]